MSSLLVIDAENIRLSEEELIYLSVHHSIDKIIIYSDMSKNNICKNYADWTFKYNHCYMVHVPSIGGKNSVDLQIAVDVIEIAICDRSIKEFLIASNDRDFLPLCKKLVVFQKKVSMIVYESINPVLETFVYKTIFLKHIDSDIKILIKCFILERSFILPTYSIKKIIKKLNLKKKISFYNDIEAYIRSNCNSFFSMDVDKNVILASSLLKT